MQRNTREFFETRGQYLENRAKFPLYELRKYLGKWIAWSADGSRIAASADTEEALFEILTSAGEAARGWIIEGMPEPDVDTYTGMFFDEEAT